MLSEGSFEDILYIIVGLVWLVFSIYKGSKSKRKAPAKPDNSAEEESVLSSLIDWMEEKSKPEEDNDIPYDREEHTFDPVFTPQETTEEKIFSYDDIYEEEDYNPVSEEISATERTTTSTHSNELTSPAKSTKEKQLKFDIKKAIIYSEILQPKYF